MFTAFPAIKFFSKKTSKYFFKKPTVNVCNY